MNGKIYYKHNYCLKQNRDRKRKKIEVPGDVALLIEMRRRGGRTVDKFCKFTTGKFHGFPITFCNFTKFHDFPRFPMALQFVQPLHDLVARKKKSDAVTR